ncbi:hypothetical protein B6U82_00625 [Candidatus Pacearchaeota archaeon ex4484_31]|nr:MAG: hypothetical protein B6U82_00625 [Candidatus Pacearchaeota archaeon ex4484_31]
MKLFVPKGCEWHGYDFGSFLNICWHRWLFIALLFIALALCVRIKVFAEDRWFENQLMKKRKEAAEKIAKKIVKKMEKKVAKESERKIAKAIEKKLEPSRTELEKEKQEIRKARRLEKKIKELEKKLEEKSLTEEQLKDTLMRLLESIKLKKEAREKVEKKVKEKIDVKTIDEIRKMLAVKPIAVKAEKIETEFDRIINLIKKSKKGIKLSDLAKKLKIEKGKVMEWCETLAESNLIKIEYPPIGEPLIVKK